MGKAVAVDARDRETNRARAARASGGAGAASAPQGFVRARAEAGATIDTDDARGMARTNGMESFWFMLKRGYIGTHHWWSVKHLDRYVTEFADRHNVRAADTIDQMRAVAEGMIGRRMTYAELIR